MARVPRQLSGAASVALTEQEEHTLSVVDGTLDERELALATGMDPADLAEQLERLAMMGVIALEGGDDVGDRPSALPGELPDDGIALATEARQHIDKLHGLLDEADYYELLGVKRDATKGDIKAAYYQIGPGFHPDKHYGKEIGPYKAKVERIFTLLTKAHDTLRYNKRRQSYDAALPPPRAGAKQRRDAVAAAAGYFHGLAERRSKTKRPSAPPAEPTARPAPKQSYTAPSTARPPEGRTSSGVTARAPQTRAPAGDSSRPPRESYQAPATGRPADTRRPAAGTGRPPAEQPAPPPPQPSPPPAEPQRPPPQTAPQRRPAPPMTEEERRIQRDTLAKKLRSRGAPVAVTRHRLPQPVQPKVTQRDPAAIKPPAEVDRSASEVLRDRYDAIATAAKKRRLDRYLDQGRVAMAAGDYRAASAAYAQAKKLSPDDAEIADLADRSANLARQMGD